jgi:transposase-like protein
MRSIVGNVARSQMRLRLRPTNDSWRVDETYIRVKGKWVYLYRAVDFSGATIDFLLSAKRDAAAAERFLGKPLGGENHPAPRVINTDKHAGYPPAIAQLKVEGAMKENCRHRPVQYELRADRALHALLGMKRFPSDDTILNYFRRFSQAEVERFWRPCGGGSSAGFRNWKRVIVWIWIRRFFLGMAPSNKEPPEVTILADRAD